MEKYKSLKFVAAVHVFIGRLLVGLGLLVGLLLVVMALSTDHGSSAGILFVFGPVAAIIAGVFIIAQGELIRVFIDIEGNTRRGES